MCSNCLAVKSIRIHKMYSPSTYVCLRSGSFNLYQNSLCREVAVNGRSFPECKAHKHKPALAEIPPGLSEHCFPGCAVTLLQHCKWTQVPLGLWRFIEHCFKNTTWKKGVHFFLFSLTKWFSMAEESIGTCEQNLSVISMTFDVYTRHLQLLGLCAYLA